MKKKLGILCIGIFMSLNCITRADTDDLLMEFEAGISHKLNETWKMTVTEKPTYNRDGQLLAHETDLGFVYSGLAEGLTLSMNFRYAEGNPTGKFWIREYRPHFNVKFKDTIWGMPWSNRTRIEYRDFDGIKDRWRLRNKLLLDLPFEIPVLNAQPYIGDEIFFVLSENGYNRNRVYSGLKFNLLKNLKADVYYYWVKAQRTGRWDEASVLGAKLIYEF